MNGYLKSGAACMAMVATCCNARAEAPETMVAMRIHQYGDASVMVRDEVPVPKPGAGEVLVRIKAAGVNPVDWKIRDGAFSRGAALANPLTLGLDISGIVETIGPGVEGFDVGDEVFAMLNLRSGLGGGYAQYATVQAESLARKPESIDHIHAAGVPLAALTAWQALVDTAELGDGQTALIHGGAGGVGHFAVQIAKARGAHVITTASPRNHEFLRELGADEVIDYRTQNFWEIASDVDVVLDSIGGQTQARSIEVLKPGGIIVSIVGNVDQAALEQHGVRGTMVLVRPNGEQLEVLATLIDEGTINPHISMVVPLEEVAKAHEQSETGHTRGKIVLTMD